MPPGPLDPHRLPPQVVLADGPAVLLRDVDEARACLVRELADDSRGLAGTAAAP